MGKFNQGKRFGGGGHSFGDKRFGGGGHSFGGGRDGGRPTMHKGTCSECGQECELPFKPTGDRPVFCSTCFGKQNSDSRPAKFGSDSRRERPRFEDKQMFDAICSKCGAKCQVPFRPSPGKQVFCDNCFDKGGVSTKSAPDYSGQFKMVNEKLDKLIRLLTPSTTVAVTEKPAVKNAVAEKKAVKEVKKPAKSKPTVKKIAGKKKK